MVRHIPTCSPEKKRLKETIQPLHFTQGQHESEEPTVKTWGNSCIHFSMEIKGLLLNILYFLNKIWNNNNKNKPTYILSMTKDDPDGREG